MSDVWRILVVESDTSLNQKLVNALRKDGYVVQGATSSTDAMRTLWSEEYDVVICALNLPGTDGLELLRWLRAHHSNVRMIVLGDTSKTGESDQHLQALESGATSYIEKPVDLRLLKDELRRLLQQTGFTANLDSFDLLDVIQIITMSRKSITLLINTGLEERGTLRFQNGELAWAEYGVLRGEEAFFALAAHKNGTVTQQLSDGQSATNVTQPLSRLIFQALQYRTKYANQQQPLGQEAGETILVPPPNTGNGSSPAHFLPDDIDDSPFGFTSEEMVPNDPSSIPQMVEERKGWWESPGQKTSVAGGPNRGADDAESTPTSAMNLPTLRQTMNTSPSLPLQGEASTLKKDSSQLPSWLTDLPTSTRIPVQPPTPSSTQMPIPPLPPSASGVSGEVRQARQTQPPQLPSRRTTEQLPRNQQAASYMQPFAPETEERRPSSPQWPQRSSSSSQWPQEPQRSSSSQWPQEPQRLSSSPQWSQAPAQASGTLSGNNPTPSSASWPEAQRQVTRKNYAALVSALQTLGYSLPGFIAAAVVNIDSHPLAQVAIDDADISQIWQLLSIVQRSAFNALQSREWGMYEETIMITALRQVLMRAIGSDKKVFLVLITTREANFTESLEIMANVEGAISAALR